MIKVYIHNKRRKIYNTNIYIYIYIEHYNGLLNKYKQPDKMKTAM